MAELENPNWVYEHVDPHAVVTHIEYAHGFWAHSFVADLTADAHFYALNGLNMQFRTVKEAVFEALSDNLVRHDFHSYAKPIKMYKRLDFSLTAEKVILECKKTY